MRRYILATAIIICCFVSADAASLFGKVIEVNSGDVITIYNLNRPVRVKLMGVDAPEMNQAFGDVAQRHLADLVFEKSVVVEYAGIAADSSLTGRVLLNDADIGAQMIRDGAAWFDLRSGDRLSANDREIYQQSETAARGEKRGLWQQENPVAPWEFVKAAKMRANVSPSSKEIVTETKPKRSGPTSELSNLTLMKGANSVPVSSSAADNDTTWVRSSARKNWTRLQPPGAGFSVEVPDGGDRLTTQEMVGDQMIDVNRYRVRDGWAVYSVGWFKGPFLGESDEIVFKSMLKEFMAAAAESFKYDNRRSDFDCQSLSGKSLSQNGYSGIEYDLRPCKVPWRVRMYTKVVDKERQVYLGATAFAEEDTANAARFMKSFTVGTAKAGSR